MLIDSAPLIYWLDDYPEFAAKFEALFDLHERAQIQIAISTIAVAEVLAGPFKAKQEVLAKQYEKALASFEIVPVSVEIAVSAARLRSTAGLRLPDAIVAATALEIGATALVTHDRDFSKLQGLRVLSGQL
ncbi:MAG: PIN domain-containing protein [Burkholderiaceae bacterium]